MLRVQPAQLVQLRHAAAAALPVQPEQPVRRLDQRGGQRHPLPALAQAPGNLGLLVAQRQALLTNIASSSGFSPSRCSFSITWS